MRHQRALSSVAISKTGERHCISGMTLFWLRGVDLNHRPLGYESKKTSVFNNLQDAGGP